MIDGKKHGVKTFIVQLRDTKCVLLPLLPFVLESDWISSRPLFRSFMLLPGINIMDIGKKMGRDGIDNGAIQCVQLVPRALDLGNAFADLSISIII